MATVILQARLGSTRLPGKASMEIMGQPMLYYTVASLKQAPGVDRVVLAIPDNPKDDELVVWAEEWGIDCFRGSEPNVLERFFWAGLVYRDEYYFRATGDNPVLDCENPGRLLQLLKETGCDYAAEKGMPLGSAVEAFTFDALDRCYSLAKSEEDREHVTLFMKRKENRDTFDVRFPDAPEEYRYPGLRLTVDFQEDFDRAAEIIGNLYGDGIPPFGKIIEFAHERNWLE